MNNQDGEEPRLKDESFEIINWKRNAAIFLSCQAISIFGSSLAQFAILWYITLKTQSGIYTMIYIICAILPTFFLSPFGGVWADRYSRKLLIVSADGGIAFATLSLALLFMTGHEWLWFLFIMGGIRALGAAVQNPAVGAMLPDIVPAQHLTRVNGINSTMQSIIGLASPMLSGALLGLTSITVIFFVDVVTAILAISIMLYFFKIPKRKTKPSNDNYFKDLREGFKYIGKNKQLMHFFIFGGVYFFMIAPLAFLAPLQVTRSFGADIWRLTAVEVAFAAGMIVGGIIMVSWGGFKNRIKTVASACIIMGLCTIAIGLPMQFWLYLTLMIIAGVSMPALNTSGMVFLQENADPAYIGRVFGVMTMISSCTMPLGMLLFGPAADFIAIEWLMVASGIVMTASAIIIGRDKAVNAVRSDS